MLRNLEVAANHPDMTPELAEILSTPNVTIQHRGYDLDVEPLGQARRQ